MNRRGFLLGAGVAVCAAAAGFAVNLWRHKESGGDGAALMAARLPDLAGRARPLEEWRGKVLVVNFWATWCAPCREEIPLFVRYQDRYGSRGLQFVGIAIDEAGKVRDFAAEFGINYPTLLGGLDALELARSAGNRAGALPYTVVLDRQGRIAGARLGGMKEAALESLITPLL